ncbi:MAG: hypothetical protein ACKVXR_06670 [Planctomycetota bacterium]
MRPSRFPIAVPLLAALAGMPASGCQVVEAKAWNLDQLHDESTEHRYTAAIEGDTEYFFRHVLTRSLGIETNLEKKDPSAVEDPAQTCLETLVELEEHDGSSAQVSAIQVEWFARLAVLDPWVLSRERAVLGLSRAAARLSAGVPTGLPKDAEPAGAQAASEALAGLVRAARPVLDRGSRASPSERLDLEAACRVVTDLVLDLDGARRLLRATAELAGAVGDQNVAGQPLLRLSEDLKRRCIRQALAKALLDVEPRVRAAAVEASVASAGTKVLDEFLLQLDRESSPEVLLRVVDLVREHGLPVGVPEGAKMTEEEARERRLEALMDLLVRPETSVRVGAMRALGKVSGAGFSSLREEDWQAWWLGRVAQRPVKPAVTP